MKESASYQSPISSEDVRIKNKGQGRIFENPILDFFTRSSPTITIVNYGLIIASMLVLNARWGMVEGLWNVVALYAAGLIFWTLAEYLLHRYVFHYISENKIWMKIHYAMHGYHHEYPKDPERLFMPPLPGWVLSYVFALVFFVLFFLVGQSSISLAFTAGFVNGYLMYTLMHYSIHRVKPPKFMKGVWKHHTLHHYKHHDLAFGVSSPIWDYVFRTLPPENKQEK